MPAGNGTGPMGMGPMTGRGMGFCAGVMAPGATNLLPGEGFGLGCGRGFRGRGAGGGRGRRNMFYATGMTGWQRASTGQSMAGGVPTPANAPSREQELAALKNRADYFEHALVELRKRIEEIDVTREEK